VNDMSMTAALAKFMLREYYRATGLACETLTACLFIFLFSDHYWLLKPFDIYFGLGMFAVTASFLTTYRVAGREANSRIYIILTKKVSRRQYLLAKLEASFAIVAAATAGLFILGYCLCDIRSSFSFVEAALRLIPIYVAALAVAAITLFFSKIVYSNMISAIVLIIFSFAHPPGFLNYILPPVQQLIKMSFNVFEPYGLIYVFWGVLCAAFFYAAAVRVFRARELNFDSD